MSKVQTLIDSLTPSQQSFLKQTALGVIARANDAPRNFAAFYELVFERPLPAHARDEWLPPLYAAREAGLGLVLQAFRGSSKTTTLTVAWLAFQIGHHPQHSYMIVQGSDESAKENARQVADLIANNPGWRSAFPHIVPDKAVTWGSSGYEIKCTDMAYKDWRELCLQVKGKDPSFIGLGYRSRAIVGKHPTGGLVVDDLHDEYNSRDGRELETVRAILLGTILPTVPPGAWQLFIGTPWSTNDALSYLESTGRYIAVHTPIYREVGVILMENGIAKESRPGLEGGGGVLERDVGSTILQPGSDGQGASNAFLLPTPYESQDTSGVKGGKNYKKSKTPTWEERFPFVEIEKLRQQVGSTQFARMYLLDLSMAEGQHLKREWLHTYPADKIDPQWPVVIGVDYASAGVGGEDMLRKNAGRDYFAVAVGRVLPGNAGVALVDGYRGQLPQGAAQAKLIQIAAIYPTLQMVAVEAVGKGESFYQLLLRSSRLPLRAVTPGRASKAQRFELEMAPLFEFHRAWLADVEIPFIRAFREEWLGFPTAAHDDTLDAVYYMLQAGMPHLFVKERRGRIKESPWVEL